MEVSREMFTALRKQPFFKGVVVSDSMSPVIKVGEQIVVEVNPKEINRFDIIVFWREGRLVCHYLWVINRIVKPVLLQTRSMPGGKDVPITYDDLLGKVVSHRLTNWDKLKIFYRLTMNGKRKR